MKRRKDVFSNYFRKAHAAWAFFGENRSGQLVCVPKMSGAILSEHRSPDLTPTLSNHRTHRRRTKKLRRFLRTLHEGFLSRRRPLLPLPLLVPFAGHVKEQKRHAYDHAAGDLIEDERIGAVHEF